MIFELNQRLRADTFEVAVLDLSLLLLMNDKTAPWLILVPQRQEIKEMHHLDKNDLAMLAEEITLVSCLVEKVFVPDKINVASLGNIVPQLHIHIVGRFKNDRAWPGPVWGASGAEPYDATEAARLIERLKSELKI
ncbi:MAG: HIT domain-containing protein [Nitrospirae bacterium]|nr:HIT domain-containing protein [Nitrospirota bacterium]